MLGEFALPLGKGQLQRARMALLRDASSRDCLLEAASLFWSAIFYADQWPDVLQRELELVQQKLLARGAIPATIAAMDAMELDAARAQLEAFLLLAEIESRDW